MPETLIGSNAYESFSRQVQINLDEVLEWVGENLQPDQVFDKEVLKEWATENDFIKEKE